MTERTFPSEQGIASASRSAQGVLDGNAHSGRSVTPDKKLDTILSKLESVHPSHKGHRATCPVHGGTSPGDMSIGVGERWILLHCFAGCSYNDIRIALDLEWQDLVLYERTEKPKPRQRSERERELTAMACCLRLQNEPEVLQRMRFGRGWAAGALEALDVGWDGSRLTLPVRDAAGKLHDTLRYDPFSKGRKILAGKGKSRLPFPAPEVVDTDTLILVEGEGTAISLLSVGLKAVSLPGSMSLATNVVSPGSWRGAGWHRKWAERFERFRYLVAFPDCDGPGRALMGAVRYDLGRIGKELHIVDLGPKTWDGSDIADMLLKGTYDGPTRLIARNIVRELVAERAEVLVA